MRRSERLFSRARVIILLVVAIPALLLVGWLKVNAPQTPQIVFEDNIQSQSAQSFHVFNGKVASLGWIVGRDCQRGIQAYLKTAAANPDAALVGTGWLDPTTGKLIDGESNNCVQGSLSMDSVIQSIHQHRGKAYLTIAMQTDGASDAWTTAQQTAYVVHAAQSPGFIQPILAEVQRGNYDGVIM